MNNNREELYHEHNQKINSGTYSNDSYLSRYKQKKDADKPDTPPHFSSHTPYPNLHLFPTKVILNCVVVC